VIAFSMSHLTSKDILDLFDALNEKLNKLSIKGELQLVGGAVMCLVYEARPSTMDVDGLFKPSKELRILAAEVGIETGVGENWLNDGVKGFLSYQSTFNLFLDLSNLKIFCATAEYLLSMKCLAMRIGEEFHDLEDIRYLIRYLNLDSYQGVCDVIAQYYPIERFPQKTLYALEEIMEGF